MLPITPGGLGVTEGSMAVTLTAYGGGLTTAVAAVLLYRFITYWAVLPAGGLCYLSLRRRHSAALGQRTRTVTLPDQPLTLGRGSPTSRA